MTPKGLQTRLTHKLFVRLRIWSLVMFCNSLSLTPLVAAAVRSLRPLCDGLLLRWYMIEHGLAGSSFVLFRSLLLPS